jgi:hypothetical protein
MTEPETYWTRWETGMLGGRHRQGRNTTWRVWVVGGLLAILAAAVGYYAYGEWM